MQNIDHNKLAKRIHRKIKLKGYWREPKEKGTLLMLMVTEISKIFDEGRTNRNEKLADIANRIYDFCGYYKINLDKLPYIESYDLWDMINALVHEIEADRIGMTRIYGVGVKNCLAMVYKYAELNNIDILYEIDRKLKILDSIQKKKY